MKKHISALIYLAITFIILVGVQQSERSCNVQESREFEGQICNFCLTRSRYNNILASKDL